MQAAVFPADNGSYCLLLIIYDVDPLRRRLMQEDGFESALRAIPLTAEWRALGDPISDIGVMAKVENRWSRLLLNGAAVVGGLVLVGDSAMHTNPTMARGASLALAHAQHLARTIDEVAGNPIGFVAAFEAWTTDNLGVWFRSQVAADEKTLEDLANALAGNAPKAPVDPTARFGAAFAALSKRDRAVGRAFGRVANLLITPTDLGADHRVVEAVRAFLDSAPDLTPSFDAPSRAELEVALA